MDKQETLALCEQFQIRPTKSLGQNFLIQESVSRRIAALADLSSSDLVIEIGPGLGALTVELAAAAGKVIAIEIDRHLIPALQYKMSQFANSTIIHEDALKTSLRQLADGWTGPVKLAANLPYYITTPLIEKMIVELPQSTAIILMLQDEAADRLLAKPGSKLYSPLAILAAQYGRGEKVFSVPASAYMPQPHVESCVVTLTAVGGQVSQADQPTADNQVNQVSKVSQPPMNWPRYQRFLETCFAQRRKTLLNNLRTVGLTIEQMQDVRRFLADRGLAESVRAEAVGAIDFAALFQICSTT